MSKAFKSIFIGALFVTFNIYVLIDLLPNFIGATFVLNGVSSLYDTTNIREFKVAKILAMPFILLSFANIIQVGAFYDIPQVMSVVSVLLVLNQTTLFYYIFSGSIKLGDTVNNSGIRSFRNVYVTSGLSLGLILSFYNLSFLDIYNTVFITVVVIHFIVGLVGLMYLSKLKGVDYSKWRKGVDYGN